MAGIRVDNNRLYDRYLSGGSDKQDRIVCISRKKTRRRLTQA